MLFIIGKYEKAGLKTGGHHAIFWVLKVKRSKILQRLFSLGFIFYDISCTKTDLHNIYMI